MIMDASTAVMLFPPSLRRYPLPSFHIQRYDTAIFLSTVCRIPPLR